MNKFRKLKKKYPKNPKKVVDLFYNYGVGKERELNDMLLKNE